MTLRRLLLLTLLAATPLASSRALPPGVYAQLEGGVALGPAANAEAAERICAGLRAAGRSCRVVQADPEGRLPALAAGRPADPPPAARSAPETRSAPPPVARSAPVPKPVLPPAAAAVRPPPADPKPAAKAAAKAAPALGPPARPDALGPGRAIVVSLADRRLYLFDDAALVGDWPVAIGKPATPSPVGRAVIERKRRNPTWIPTAAMRRRDPTLPVLVRPGPDNPLGQYALDLDWDAYRIHGTNQPRSIGRAVSSGCFRMLPADVERLYPLVEIGTEVLVLRGPIPRAPLEPPAQPTREPTPEPTREPTPEPTREPPARTLADAS